MKLAPLALLLVASVAGAQTYYNKSTVPPLPPQSPILYATSYGACTWDATHDVAACINAAITKAAANGGGTIMVPCGTFGISSQIENHTSGIHLQGCGNGTPRSGVDTSHFLAITRLLWIGSVTASPALLVQTASGGGATTRSADVVGVTVDCDNICGTAIRISGVVFSTFNIGGAEATTTNIEFTTPTDLAGGGNQHNDIWAYSRSTSASNSPTGILLDAGCLTCFNTSYNTFHELFAWYRKGDGIVFGGADNNIIDNISDFPNSSAATGSAVVFANSAYTPPNGVAVNQYSRANRILHDGSHGIHIAGYQTGSTFTAAGGNGGTAAISPLIIATSGSASQSTSTLTFASTTGAATGETISCGGPVNGVFNGIPVGNVTSTTIDLGLTQFITAVPGSTNCTLTYGISVSAVAGSYTLTATAGAIYTLTAPAGGHTQAGIVPSGGFLTFTDMLIPWTGTANVNDAWTIVVPSSATQIAVEFIDKENNLATPTFEYGSSGYFTQTNKGYPLLFGQTCIVSSSGGGLASGVSACVFGGEADIASGEASVSVGGTGNTASGFGAFATGQNSTSNGVDSFVSGKDSTARSKFGAHCFANGKFSTLGDAQSCYQMVRGTGATGSAIQLTSDGSAAGSANCVNIPNNSAFAINMDIVAFDHTTVTKFASWNDVTGLLTRGASAAATAVALVSATPGVSFSGGTLTGQAMSITADTTNGCLNISWTPPTSNTDTWNVVARVRTVEVQ